MYGYDESLLRVPSRRRFHRLLSSENNPKPDPDGETIARRAAGEANRGGRADAHGRRRQTLTSPLQPVGHRRRRRRRRRLRAASYLPPSFLPSSLPSMADLSLVPPRPPLSLQPPCRPASRLGGRLLSTGSLQGVSAFFSCQIQISAPFTNGGCKGRRNGRSDGNWHAQTQTPCSGGSGGAAAAAPAREGSERSRLCDCEANAPLPPRQEKLLKRRIFLSGSQSVSE